MMAVVHVDWFEARLGKGYTPADVYGWLEDKPVAVHHFFDEPWWPGRFIVRAQAGGEPLNLGACPFVDQVVAWDCPDEDYYGAYWDEVKAFYDASARLAATGVDASDKDISKLVHCLLNQFRYSHRDEIRFARQFWAGLSLNGIEDPSGRNLK